MKDAMQGRRDYLSSQSIKREVEQFLSAHLDDPRAGYPYKPIDPQEPRASGDSRHADPSLIGVTVYAQGILYLDYSIYIDEEIQDFGRRLSLEQEKARVPWWLESRTVGGFPSFVIRAACAKGVHVRIGASLPRKMPVQVEQFLGEHGVDTRYLQLIDGGRMPQTLRLRFADGNQLLIVDKGDGTYGLPVPEARFDVLLVNPGEAATRRPILSELRGRNNGETVGIIARGDWAEQDWRLVEGTGFRVYLNRTELNESSKHVNGGKATWNVKANLATLWQVLKGSAVVTATLGNEGSAVVNGDSCLTHATAADVDPVTLTGPGDTHATTSSLSAVTSATDDVNSLRGNADAARLVAGKALASSLAELDEYIANHKMVVTVIPI